MPISRKKRRLYYGRVWYKDIRPAVLARAGRRCECLGECGHHEHRCSEIHGRGALTFDGIVRLAVAHRDQDSSNNASENLVVFCQACHNRFDGRARARTRSWQRYADRLRLRQQELFVIRPAHFSDVFDG